MIDENILTRIKGLNFPPLSREIIKKLEAKLDVFFSEEFKEISQIADFEYFQKFNINNLEGEGEHGVVGDTLRLRRDISLPKNILFLSEDDASLLLMKCLGKSEEIAWIAVEDLENYCEGKSLTCEALVFPNFTNFFEHLLEEEEKNR